MEREIKFRAWNKEANKFYYFKNGRYYSDQECLKCISERICDEYDWRGSKQYTGFKDKNGKEIYEESEIKPFGNFRDISKIKSIIVWIGDSFMIENANKFQVVDRTNLSPFANEEAEFSDVEIIQNIGGKHG